MRILLTTFNSSYIHKNLALRWLYVARPLDVDVDLKEYTIKDNPNLMFEYIKANNFDVVGLSVYIWNVMETREVIKLIKDYDPSIKLSNRCDHFR